MTIYLYDIVIVHQHDYTHYGEVLSRVTPTSTLMVRMVPGHPGTLKEVHISKLRETVGVPVRWVHYAEVSGYGAFPLDMLRREHAAPLNFDVSSQQLDPEFGLENMVIAQASLHRRPVWLAERWRSFGWSIRSMVSVPYFRGNAD